MKWIGILYKQPEATVQTNGVVPSYFRLRRGKRQGSGLSPALYAKHLEQLAKDWCSILDTINTFSKLSAYKFNWNKWEALPLTAYCPPQKNFQAGSFQWLSEGNRYLGILLPSNIEEKNFKSLLREISCYVDGHSCFYPNGENRMLWK